jgi:hypothetical protein
VSEALWIVVIGSVSGAVTGIVAPALIELVRARLNKPQAQSDAVSHYASAASDVADAMAEAYKRMDALGVQQQINMSEIAAMKATIDAQSKTIARFRTWATDVMSGINTLIAQVREMGAEPRWRPTPFDE